MIAQGYQSLVNRKGLNVAYGTGKLTLRDSLISLSVSRTLSFSASRNYLPPIPFCIKFNDQVYIMAKLVKTTFDTIKDRSGHIYHRSQNFTAYKRNPSIRDFLVRANTHCLSMCQYIVYNHNLSLSPPSSPLVTFTILLLYSYSTLLCIKRDYISRLTLYVAYMYYA